MREIVAFLIAGGSLLALNTVWFLSVYRILSEKWKSALSAAEQVKLHTDGFRQVKSSPQEPTARRVLSVSREIFQQIRDGYNQALRRPLCRIPGYLMGFRPLP